MSRKCGRIEMQYESLSEQHTKLLIKVNKKKVWSCAHITVLLLLLLTFSSEQEEVKEEQTIEKDLEESMRKMRESDIRNARNMINMKREVEKLRVRILFLHYLLSFSLPISNRLHTIEKHRGSGQINLLFRRAASAMCSVLMAMGCAVSEAT